jgi:hypothetical protein
LLAGDEEAVEKMCRDSQELVTAAKSGGVWRTGAMGVGIGEES